LEIQGLKKKKKKETKVIKVTLGYQGGGREGKRDKKE
jgi:hypothetical protein